MDTSRWVAAAATTALRRGSVEELASGIERYLRVLERTWDGSGDPSEIMAGLVPFVDCAGQIAADPVLLLDQVAPVVRGDLGELAHTFICSDECTLAASGWSLQESATGPEYLPAGSGAAWNGALRSLRRS